METPNQQNQNQSQSGPSGIKIFYNKCVRVWKTLKKPTRKEFEMTAKVSAIGIVILGIIGFIISILMGFFN